MGCKRVNSTRRCIHYSYMKTIGLILMLFYSTGVFAQEEDEVVKALVKAGFENVSRVVLGSEEIITFENTVWKADGTGVSNAIDIVNKFPQIIGKIRKIIVLSNNIPQISLSLPARTEISGNQIINAEDWYVSYDLDNSWKQINREEVKNSSLWKADLVFYPQFAFRNQKYHKMYDILFNISPAIEISPLRGMRITGQIIIPVFNEYGELYKEVRPGVVAVEQQFRWENCFFRLSAGNFTNNRWGADLHLFRPFTREGWLSRFALEGRVGLTGSSYFYNWNWNYGNLRTVTWNVGGSYYNARFNVQCDVKVEQFVAKDIGVRADMTRHFKNASVGFYVMKNDHGNLDGGFHFAFVIPPMKQKRRKYVRIMPARYFELEYTAAGLFYNGKFYYTSPRENKAIDNFNPYYIKSQLK